ncbi:nuclear transport factor 2 family protein [Haloplasma contractile]|uniref:SnoaL-like domain protein n=1 Tax=Haloplasma contractile SSD-17B TaxID=1033810 RepID=U2FEN9_9MOLU|nr:nuclear transport factor 2 family protein [Haloplasma contractile]ERJ11415.1 SnoaL-like domain protein [Haloplasma contractile SSD-17B]
MIDVISVCIDGFEYKKFGLITENIDDDCLFLTSKSQPVLGKAKIVNYFERIHDTYTNLSFNLLNSAIDSDDTVLISWAFRGTKKLDDSSISLFGTSVVHFNKDKKVRHVKSTVINA